MLALRLMMQCADTASMNIAIAASNRADHWPLGLSILSAMHCSDLQADTISYNSAAGSMKWEAALWVTGARKDDEMDVVGLNAILTAGSDWCQVVSLLAKAPQMRLQVNIRCLTGALSVCERTSVWQRATNLVDSALGRCSNGYEEMDIAPDKKSMSSLISACGKGFQWEAAVFLSMVQMPQRSILPDAITFCVAINACKDDSDWAAAIGIFAGLKCFGASEGIVRTPDMASAYQLTISSCRLQWKLSLRMLQRMSSARVHKSGQLGDEACLNAAVSACDAGNIWRKAIEISLRRCNLIGTNSAISACGDHSSRWEVALELQDMQVQRSLQIDTWP